MPFPYVDTLRDSDQIYERNGVWVVTINGVWHGDYMQREHAVAAVVEARSDTRPFGHQ